jgi:hypothetical protein
MTLLRVLVLGPLSITTNTLIASEFKCPTPSQFQNVACENSITVTPLCRKYFRDTKKTSLTLVCIDKESNADLLCWDDLEIVVYFCPSNSTDVSSECKQFLGTAPAGNYKYNSRVNFSPDNSVDRPVVFACQQKKRNNSEDLDFEFIEN